MLPINRKLVKLGTRALSSSAASFKHQLSGQGTQRTAAIHHQSHAQAQALQTTIRATTHNNDHLRGGSAAAALTLSSPFDPPVQISRINTHYCREPQLVMIAGYGILQGQMDKSRLLTKYLNIPFATVHDSKKEAVAPESWTGIRDATVLG